MFLGWNRKTCAAVLLLASVAMTAGCSGAKKGAAIGGAVGAATGAVIGHQGGRTGTGAVAGAAVGAAAGAIIGDYMAKQKQELEQVPGAEVVQEGEELKVKFASAILFDVDSYMLKASAQANLREMAAILARYPDTNLVIHGHTDNTGSESYNQRLSERRAKSVQDYLGSNGVGGNRLAAFGHGEMQPISSNETADGRSQNRRVEVQIAANEQLRQRAEQQAQSQGR